MGKKWRSGGPSPALAFAQALYAARKAMSLEHGDLAAKLGVSTRTLVRWEGGKTLPREYMRDAVITWAGTLRRTHAEPVLRGLGVMMPDEAMGATSPEDLATARILLDHAVLSTAEAHDVPPRALRRAVVAVLEAARKTNVSMAMATTMLAPTAAAAIVEPPPASAPASKKPARSTRA